MKNELTFERASELLRYDEETGKIFWRVTRGGWIKDGAEAGSQWRNTYRQIKIDGRLYKAHRVAWLLHYGVWPKNQIDHIDGDGLNNRPENMRDVTQRENTRNARMRSDNTSSVTGVYWYKPYGTWKAQININGKRKHLGYFTDFGEAAAAYRKAAEANGFTERHGAVA